MANRPIGLSFNNWIRFESELDHLSSNCREKIDMHYATA